ncbi:MAG: DedA family protein [Bacteroidales bacterium]|jgi:membrane protein DedA with SNARE-associated domain|nr:DedA family protein [Bacteroidales bacterium]
MRKKSLLFTFAALLFANAAFATEQKTDSLTIEKNQSSIEKVVSWYEKNLNYGTITLLMTIESSFIPFPSEVVVPPAAYKALKPESNMNIILVIVFATIGALLGSLINYFLAMWLGRPIVYKFAESRIGKLCLLDKEKVQQAEAYFNKHGKSSTFIGRFVPGIRQLISIPAGLARMPLRSFLLYTALGAVLWNIILAILGYLAHGQQDLINKYSSELSYLLLGLGILFVIYLVYKAFFSKKKEKK